MEEETKLNLLKKIKKSHLDFEEAFGFPCIFYHIKQSSGKGLDRSDLQVLRQLLSQKVNRKIGLVLRIPGGEVGASYRMAKTLGAFTSGYQLFVPELCISAGTILALGADAIHLSTIAEMGPIDPQITIQRDGHIIATYSAHDVLSVPNNIKKMCDKKVSSTASTLYFEALFRESSPIHLGKLFSSLEFVEKISLELIRNQLPNTDAKTLESIVQILIEGYPVHDYPLYASDLKKIGLNIYFFDTKIELLLNNMMLAVKYLYQIEEKSYAALFSSSEKLFFNLSGNVRTTEITEEYIQAEFNWVECDEY